VKLARHLEVERSEREYDARIAALVTQQREPSYKKLAGRTLT